jgi:uncharacterized membrane protein
LDRHSWLPSHFLQTQSRPIWSCMSIFFIVFMPAHDPSLITQIVSTKFSCPCHHLYHCSTCTKLWAYYALLSLAVSYGITVVFICSRLCLHFSPSR